MCATIGTAALSAAAVLGAWAPAANASDWNPIAFGPVGGLPAGQYFTTIPDISGDGRTFFGVTNIGQVIWRTPGGDYSLTGVGSPFAISRNGQTLSGGINGQAPRRWDLSSAVGSSVASQAIAVPGNAFPSSPAYAVNSNGTHFATPTPTAVMSATMYQGANAAFNAMNPLASAGAFRGLASDAPVMVVLGTMPGNPTNAYRWNYESGTASALDMPAGASSIDPGAVNASVSADASRVGGSATIGGISQPYWWDAAGSPHAVTPLPGSLFGTMSAMNYTGTLGGGSMWLSGQGNRAFLYEPGTGEVYNLNQVYSAAGMLPAGWTLIATRHISDDGSRVFCTATAPDGSSRMVLLEGNYIPAPGAMGLAAVAGLFASRRRRGV